MPLPPIHKHTWHFSIYTKKNIPWTPCDEHRLKCSTQSTRPNWRSALGWKAFANASNDGKKRSLTGQLCKYIRSKEDTICLSIRVIEDNEICKTIHELYELGMCMWHVRRVRRVQVASKSVLSCTEYPLFYRYNSSSYFFWLGSIIRLWSKWWI